MTFNLLYCLTVLLVCIQFFQWQLIIVRVTLPGFRFCSWSVFGCGTSIHQALFSLINNTLELRCMLSLQKCRQRYDDTLQHLHSPHATVWCESDLNVDRDNFGMDVTVWTCNNFRIIWYFDSIHLQYLMDI